MIVRAKIGTHPLTRITLDGRQKPFCVGKHIKFKQADRNGTFHGAKWQTGIIRGTPEAGPWLHKNHYSIDRL